MHRGLELRDLREVQLGLWTLSITESAELIAFSMWSEGSLDDKIKGVPVPKRGGSLSDESGLTPEIRAALQEAILKLESLLCSGVEKGTITPSLVERDVNDESLSKKTRIHLLELRSWLMGRGLWTGLFFYEWEESEAVIHHHIAGELEALRAARAAGPDVFEAIMDQQERPSALALSASQKVRLWECYKAAGQIRGRENDVELKPTSRRTHRQIIAALCSELGIDWESSTATSRVSEALDKIGLPKDRKTIRTILQGIPDALDS